MLLLASCAGDDVASGGNRAKENPDAVSFSTTVEHETATRATTGLISNDEALKRVTEGFGVFAYLTETQDFKTKFPAVPASGEPSKEASAYSGFSNFFMQNQQVRWGVQYVENGDDADLTNDVNHYDWVYSPLKYWPNYTNNEDSSDGHETPGPRYISFFAYAPWVDTSTNPTSGIVACTRADDRSPHVIYKLGRYNEQVDLLWANAIDARRNGNGLISVGRNEKDTEDPLLFQKVPLEFNHALAGIDIYVQRVYDEPAYTGKIPKAVLYPTIYINQLKLTSTALDADNKNWLQTSGKLSLIDGTWSDPGAPNAWTADEVTLTYSDQMINDTISGTLSDDEEYIRDIELDKWKWILDTKGNDSADDDEWVDATTISEAELTANPTRWKDAYGLSEVERNLIKNGVTQMLIPRKVTLIPTLTYSMVVRNDDLQLNYLTDSEGHRYSRIINEIKGNSITLDLKAGKRYTLLIRVGVEHVTFQVVSIVDWDFPMRYTPTLIKDFEKELNGKIVNEQ